MPTTQKASTARAMTALWKVSRIWFPSVNLYKRDQLTIERDAIVMLVCLDALEIISGALEVAGTRLEYP